MERNSCGCAAVLGGSRWVFVFAFLVQSMSLVNLLAPSEWLGTGRSGLGIGDPGLEAGGWRVECKVESGLGGARTQPWSDELLRVSQHFCGK